MRFISATKRFVNADTAAREGPSLAGFQIRPGDEGGLSVTHVEHFGIMSHDSRVAAAVAHRESTQSKKLGPAAIFAWARVEKIRSAGVPYGKAIRVVHAPVDGNPAHAEIRHFTDDDLKLLDDYATRVFAEWQTVAEMNIPTP